MKRNSFLGTNAIHAIFIYSYDIKLTGLNVQWKWERAEVDFVTSVIAPASIASSLFRPFRHWRDFAVKLSEFPGEHATSKSRSNLT